MKKMNILLVLVILIFAGCTEKKAGSFETAQVEEEIKETKEFTEDNHAETKITDKETLKNDISTSSTKEIESEISGNEASLTETTVDLNSIQGDISAEKLMLATWPYWSLDGKKFDLERFMQDQGFESQTFKFLNEYPSFWFGFTMLQDNRKGGVEARSSVWLSYSDTDKNQKITAVARDTLSDPITVNIYDLFISERCSTYREDAGVWFESEALDDPDFFKRDVEITAKEDMIIYSSKASILMCIVFCQKLKNQEVFERMLVRDPHVVDDMVDYFVVPLGEIYHYEYIDEELVYKSWIDIGRNVKNLGAQ